MKTTKWEIVDGKIISVDALVAYVAKNSACITDNNFSPEQLVAEQRRHESGPHNPTNCRFCEFDQLALKYVKDQPKVIP